MNTVTVWVLVVFGAVAAGGDSGYPVHGPQIVINDIATKDQCMKLGGRIVNYSNQLASEILRNPSNRYMCTGYSKVIGSRGPQS